MPGNSIDIVILEDSSQSGFGGGQRVTLEVARALEGVKKMMLLDTVDSLLIKKLSDSISKKNLGLNNLNFRSLRFNTILVWKTALEIIQARPNHIYVCTRKNLFSAILVKLLRPKIKITYHQHLVPSRGKIANFFAFIGLLFCHCIICASHFVLSRYQAMLLPKAMRAKIKVSPIPPPKWQIDSEISDLIPQGSFLRSKVLKVGYVGRLSPEKGILEFLLAAEQFKSSEKVEFVIAGSGILSDRVEKLSSTNSHLKYLGLVETDFSFYRSLDLLIVPTIGVDESLGLVPIEGFQAGLKVYVSERGNLKYLAASGMAKILEEPCNADAIVKAIKAELTERDQIGPMRVKKVENLESAKISDLSFVSFFQSHFVS